MAKDIEIRIKSQFANGGFNQALKSIDQLTQRLTKLNNAFNKVASTKGNQNMSRQIDNMSKALAKAAAMSDKSTRKIVDNEQKAAAAAETAAKKSADAAEKAAQKALDLYIKAEKRKSDARQKEVARQQAAELKAADAAAKAAQGNYDKEVAARKRAVDALAREDEREQKKAEDAAKRVSEARQKYLEKVKSNSLDQQSRDITKYTQLIERLGSVVKPTAAQTKQLTDAQQRLAMLLGQANSQVANSMSRWQAWRNTLSSALAPIQRFTGYLSGLRNALSGIGRALSAPVHALSSFGSLLGRVAQTGASNFARLQSAVQSAGRTFLSFGRNVQNGLGLSNRAIQQTAGGWSLLTSGRMMTNLGKGILTGGGLFGSDYLDYEKAATRAAISGNTDFGTINNLVMGMERGKYGGYSLGRPVYSLGSTDIANGIYYLASAVGMDIGGADQAQQAQLLAMLNPMLQTAAYTMTSPETLIKGALNLGMEFGYNPRDFKQAGMFGNIASTMGFLANISSMEVPDIVNAARYTGSMAHAVLGGQPGNGLADILTAMFFSSEVGLKGSKIGSGMDRIVGSMLDPTEKMLGLAAQTFGIGADRESWKKYFFDDKGHMKGGFGGFLSKFMDPSLGSSANELLASFFTQNATRSMIGMIQGMRNDPKQWQAISQKLIAGDTNGALKLLNEAIAKSNDTVGAHLQNIKNAWLAANTSIIQSIKGPLNKALEVLGNALFKIADIVNKNPILGKFLALFAASLGSILAVAGAFLTMAGTLLLLHRGLIFVHGAGSLVFSLFTAIPSVLLSFIPILLLLGAAALALYQAWNKNFMGIRGLYYEFVADFNAAFNKHVIPVLQDAAKYMDMFVAVFLKASADVLAKIRELVKEFGPLFKAFGSGVLKGAASAFLAIAAAVQQVAQVVGPAISGLKSMTSQAETLGNIIGFVLGTILAVRIAASLPLVGALIRTFVQLGSTIVAVAAQLGVLLFAFDPLFAVIVLIGAAIATYIGVTQGWGAAFDQLTAFVAGFVAVFYVAYQGAMAFGTWLMQSLSPLQAFVSWLTQGTNAMTVFGAIAAVVAVTIGVTYVAAMVSAIITTGTFIAELAIGAVGALMGFLGAIIATLGPIGLLIAAIVLIVGAILQFGFGIDVIGALSDAFSYLVHHIDNVARAIVNAGRALKDFFTTSKDESLTTQITLMKGDLEREISNARAAAQQSTLSDSAYLNYLSANKLSQDDLSYQQYLSEQDAKVVQQARDAWITRNGGYQTVYGAGNFGSYQQSLDPIAYAEYQRAHLGDSSQSDQIASYINTGQEVSGPGKGVFGVLQERIGRIKAQIKDGVEGVQKQVYDLLGIPDGDWSKFSIANLAKKYTGDTSFTGVSSFMDMLDPQMKGYIEAGQKYAKYQEMVAKVGKDMADAFYKANDQPIPLPPNLQEWLSSADEGVNELGASAEETAQKLQDMATFNQSALQSLTSLTLPQAMKSAFSQGNSFGFVSIPEAMATYADQITQNIPEGATWSNIYEGIMDAVGMGISNPNVGGKNLHTILKNSPGFQNWAAEMGLAVDDLLKDVPKYVHAEELVPLAFSEVAKAAQNIAPAIYKKLDLLGSEMNGTGLDWKEVTDFAISNSQAGVSWNLVDYISQTYDMSLEEASKYIIDHGIDPNILNSSMFGGLDLAVWSQGGQVNVFDENWYDWFQQVTGGGTDKIVELTKEQFAAIPDAIKASMTAMGYAFVIGGQQVAEDARASNQAIIDSIKQAHPGLKGAIEEIGRTTDEFGNEMILVKDAAGNEWSLTPPEYSAYKSALEEINRLNKETYEKRHILEILFGGKDKKNSSGVAPTIEAAQVYGQGLTTDSGSYITVDDILPPQIDITNRVQQGISNALTNLPTSITSMDMTPFETLGSQAGRAFADAFTAAMAGVTGGGAPNPSPGIGMGPPPAASPTQSMTMTVNVGADITKLLDTLGGVVAPVFDAWDGRWMWLFAGLDYSAYMASASPLATSINGFSNKWMWMFAGLDASAFWAVYNTLPTYKILTIITTQAASTADVGFHARGGFVNSDLQVVGEQGPELVRLPRGSYVHTAADTARMVSNLGSSSNMSSGDSSSTGGLGDGSNAVVVNLYGDMHVRSDKDIEAIAKRVDYLIGKRTRTKGRVLSVDDNRTNF